MGETRLTLRPGPVEVFPHPPPSRATLLPADLLRRIGEHTAAAPGAGIEFYGIRGYQPGDRLRDLNWAVTSRLGQPHVNQRAALRAADLVIMIDAFSDVGPPGGTTLDVAVRGAAGLATAYLRTGDRVGVVVLGGVLRWLRALPRQPAVLPDRGDGVRRPLPQRGHPGPGPRAAHRAAAARPGGPVLAAARPACPERGGRPARSVASPWWSWMSCSTSHRRNRGCPCRSSRSGSGGWTAPPCGPVSPAWACRC